MTPLSSLLPDEDFKVELNQHKIREQSWLVVGKWEVLIY